jgi:hypothetical protein
MIHEPCSSTPCDAVCQAIFRRYMQGEQVRISHSSYQMHFFRDYSRTDLLGNMRLISTDPSSQPYLYIFFSSLVHSYLSLHIPQINNPALHYPRQSGNKDNIIFISDQRSTDMSNEIAQMIMAGIHPSGGEDRYSRADLAQGIDVAVELGIFNIRQRAIAHQRAITEGMVDLTVQAGYRQIELKRQVDEIDHQLQQRLELVRNRRPGSGSTG